MERITKARPIALEDIRYLECEGLVDEGVHHGYTDALFHVPRQASARANRLAQLCRERKVSIAKRSLYLCFTPAIPEGAIRPTEYRNEVWQRYVMFGLSPGFNQCDEKARIDRIWLATIESLRAIAPEHVDAIEEAAAIVEAGGEDLAFILASKKDKRYLVELSYTMPTWPDMASLLLTLTDGVTGTKNSCVLFRSKLSNECGFLGGKIKVVDGNIVVRPQANRWGNFYAKKNNVSFFVVDIEAVIQGVAVVKNTPYETRDI